MGHSHRIAVRFSDCDMYGHVNNAVFLTYFEEATGRLVATGRSAQVMYDHVAKATTPMAYDVRCALEALRVP